MFFCLHAYNLCMLKSQSVYFLPLLLTSDHLEKQTIKISLISNRMIYICESFEKDLLVGLELELMTLLLVVIKFLGPNFFSLLAILAPHTPCYIRGIYQKYEMFLCKRFCCTDFFRKFVDDDTSSCLHLTISFSATC